MAIRAPTDEPWAKPRTSGLPSGLRETVWKTAPEIPNATPTNRPTSTRGSRSSCTMYCWPGSPPPVREASTSPGVIG